MPLKKISQLTAGGALDGTESVEIVQAGNSRRTTVRDILDDARHPIIPAESAAGVTPVDFSYHELNLLRYGTNTTPGTTDMQGALANLALVYAQLIDSRTVLSATGGTTSFGDAPIAVIPPGRYAVSDETTWGKFLRLDMRGATFEQLAGFPADGFVFKSTTIYRWESWGGSFLQTDGVASLTNSNVNRTKIIFHGIEAHLCTSTAFYFEAESATIDFYDPIWYANKIALHLFYDTTGSVSYVNVWGGWIRAHDSAANEDADIINEGTFVAPDDFAGGVINFKGTIFVPTDDATGFSDIAWVENSGRGVTFRDCRGGGEAGAKALVNQKTTAFDAGNLFGSWVIVDGCEISSRAPTGDRVATVRLYDCPNLLQVTNNHGAVNAKVMDWQSAVTPATLLSGKTTDDICVTVSGNYTRFSSDSGQGTGGANFVLEELRPYLDEKRGDKWNSRPSGMDGFPSIGEAMTDQDTTESSVTVDFGISGADISAYSDLEEFIQRSFRVEMTARASTGDARYRGRWTGELNFTVEDDGTNAILRANLTEISNRQGGVNATRADPFTTFTVEFEDSGTAETNLADTESRSLVFRIDPSQDVTDTAIAVRDLSDGTFGF